MPNSLHDRARKLARNNCASESHYGQETCTNCERVADDVVAFAREFATEALRAYVDEPYNAQQTDAEAITAVNAIKQTSSMMELLRKALRGETPEEKEAAVNKLFARIEAQEVPF